MIGPVVLNPNGVRQTVPLITGLRAVSAVEQNREKCRRYYAKTRAEKLKKNADSRRERYANDPDYRERRKAYERAYRRGDAYAGPATPHYPWTEGELAVVNAADSIAAAKAAYRAAFPASARTPKAVQTKWYALRRSA